MENNMTKTDRIATNRFNVNEKYEEIATGRELTCKAVWEGRPVFAFIQTDEWCKRVGFPAGSVGMFYVSDPEKCTTSHFRRIS